MDGMKYQLSSYKDIDRVLIPFLEEFPLLTSKYLNYLDFQKAIEILKNGEHLTREGIEKLKELAQKMNTNRSFKDKWEFTQKHCSKAVITPEWIQGFTDAEGCFYFFIGKQKIKGKESSTWLLQASLEIAQNTHDVAVLEMIKRYFNCGIIKPKRQDNSIETAQSTRSVSRYVISNLTDVMETVIPFFDNYSLLTNKSLDYLDWKRLIGMKNSKQHYTEEGIKQIKLIKSNMNRGRGLSPSNLSSKG
jgi:hypothetical protein